MKNWKVSLVRYLSRNPLNCFLYIYLKCALSNMTLLLYTIQTSFCFAGALKMEEISRSLISMLSKHSTVSIRQKFSRLREINNVLTADYGASQSNILMENYSYLTTNEVLMFASLRLEK